MLWESFGGHFAFVLLSILRLEIMFKCEMILKLTFFRYFQAAINSQSPISCPEIVCFWQKESFSSLKRSIQKKKKRWRETETAPLPICAAQVNDFVAELAFSDFISRYFRSVGKFLLQASSNRKLLGANYS